MCPLEGTSEHHRMFTDLFRRRFIEIMPDNLCLGGSPQSLFSRLFFRLYVFSFQLQADDWPSFSKLNLNAPVERGVYDADTIDKGPVSAFEIFDPPLFSVERNFDMLQIGRA